VASRKGGEEDSLVAAVAWQEVQGAQTELVKQDTVGQGDPPESQGTMAIGLGVWPAGIERQRGKIDQTRGTRGRVRSSRYAAAA
jgi:hypothetical protein